MRKKKLEFSKTLLIQESALIWIMTIAFIVLSFFCVMNGFFGELPWLAAMVAFPWTAYGVSQAFYYRKSEKENTKNGIKYETAILERYNANMEIQQKYQNIMNIVNEVSENQNSEAVG